MSKLFMKSTPPPPTEYTEEQTSHNYTAKIYPDSAPNFGQRLTIANRKVSKLGFWLIKIGAPTGNLTLQIMRVSDDGIAASKVWGDVSGLPAEITYIEVEFDTPVTINEEVRIVANHVGGTSSNCVAIRLQLSDVKADEYTSYSAPAGWTDQTTWDTAYRYKYYEV